MTYDLYLWRPTRERVPHELWDESASPSHEQLLHSLMPRLVEALAAHPEPLDRFVFGDLAGVGTEAGAMAWVQYATDADGSGLDVTFHRAYIEVHLAYGPLGTRGFGPMLTTIGQLAAVGRLAVFDPQLDRVVDTTADGRQMFASYRGTVGTIDRIFTPNTTTSAPPGAGAASSADIAQRLRAVGLNAVPISDFPEFHKVAAVLALCRWVNGGKPRGR